MEFIGTLVSAVKEAGPRIYAAVFVAASAMLLFPSGVLNTLGLTEFRSAHKTELGLALLITGSLLLMQMAFFFGGLIIGPIGNRMFFSKIRKTLSQLTEEEKKFLRPYIWGGDNSNYASIYDGVANGLQAKKIVFRASTVSVPGHPGMMFPFNLQPYVREELNKNPDLLNQVP